MYKNIQLSDNQNTHTIIIHWYLQWVDKTYAQLSSIDIPFDRQKCVYNHSPLVDLFNEQKHTQTFSNDQDYQWTKICIQLFSIDSNIE